VWDYTSIRTLVPSSTELDDMGGWSRPTCLAKGRSPTGTIGWPTLLWVGWEVLGVRG